MRIKDIRPASGLATLKSDEYTPFEIQIGEVELRGLYLRYFSDYSLLELGICPTEGLLKLIRLVQVPGISDLPFPEAPSDFIEGVPAFNLACWEDKKSIDIEQQVIFAVQGNSILLAIDGAVKFDVVSKSGCTVFGMKEGELTWIMVNDLGNSEIAMIKDCISQNAPGRYL